MNKDDMVSVRRKDIENLVYYADTCALILKQSGYQGKAEALDNRYSLIAEQIGLKPNSDNKINNGE